MENPEVFFSRFYPRSLDQIASEFPDSFYSFIGVLLAEEERKKPIIFGSEEKIHNVSLLRYPFYLVSINGRSLAYNGRSQSAGRIECFVLPTRDLTLDIARFNDLLSKPQELTLSIGNLQEKMEPLSLSISQNGLVTQGEIVREIAELHQSSERAASNNKETILPSNLLPESIHNSSTDIAEILVSLKKSKTFLDYLEEKCDSLYARVQKEVALGTLELKEEFENQIATMKPDVNRRVRRLETERKEQMESIEAHKDLMIKPIQRQIKTLQTKLARAEQSLAHKVRKLSSKGASKTRESKKFWSKRVDSARKQVKQIESQTNESERRISAFVKLAQEKADRANFLFSSRIYSQQDVVRALETKRDDQLAKFVKLIETVRSGTQILLRKLKEFRKTMENALSIFDSMTIDTKQNTSLIVLGIPIWLVSMDRGKGNLRTLVKMGDLRFPSGGSGTGVTVLQGKLETQLWKLIEVDLELNPIPNGVLDEFNKKPKLSKQNFDSLLSALGERKLIPVEQMQELRGLISEAL